MEINWNIKHFNELSTIELHDIVAFRISIFVVEQNCPYQELDGKDKKAYHIVGRNGLGDILAVARILPSGISYKEVSIGRVASDYKTRGTGFGNSLMEVCMKFCREEFGEVPIRISAQSHLEKYYERFGFKSTGKHYLEDDIPHTEMLFG
jgi:ElaA protein